MATKTKKTDEVAADEPTVIKFGKEKILTFKRFAGRVDLLRTLLEDGREYTIEEASAAIEKFMKGGK